MPGKCCVPNCRGNYANGPRVSTFGFPKDTHVMGSWIRAIKRDNFTPTSNSRVCELHFEEREIERQAQFCIEGTQEVVFVPLKKARLVKDAVPSKLPGCPRYLNKEGQPASLEDTTNPDWIPTQNMGYESAEEQESNRQDPSTVITSCQEPEQYKMDSEDAGLNDESDENVICEIKAPSDVEEKHPVTKVQIPNGDNTLSIKISSHLCRLCLENSPQMWNFFSILTLEDQSTIDIPAAFQKLTGEHVEENKNSKLPKHICTTCVDLLVAAHLFQQKYEKTSTILKAFLNEDGEIGKESANDDELSENENMTVQENSLIEESESDSDPSTKITEEFLDDDLDSTMQPKQTDVDKEETILHSCPICLNKFTALELKRHCQSHKSLKRYLKAAPRFNKKVRFFARPQNNVCLFYRQPVSHACPFCSEEFDSNTFLTHVRQHRTEGNYRCNICNRIFLGRNHLKYHQLSHKKESPYKCPDCGKGFFKRANFDFHKLSHTMSDDLPFKCKYCMKGFSNPQPLKRHIFNHENDISYGKHYSLNKDYVTCRHCQQKLKSSIELEQHTCRYCCAKCHKIFGTKREFTKHVCKYQLKSWQCDPCGKTFQLPSSKRAHKYRCGYRTLCYVCGKNVANIAQHLQSHFGKKKTYSCADCGNQFRYKEGLTKHIKQVHLKLNLFQCQYCSKLFGSKWNLAMHERIHVGEKKHICQVCHKTFLEKSYLNRHLRVHQAVNGCT